jgi:nucleoid-associated protein YgaU
MQTPIGSVGQSLERAYLEILSPANDPDPVIELRFNPTEYQIQKSNNFAEIPIPGLESPPIQFVRGGCEKLTAELLADTSDTLDDVRTMYTDRLRNLMKIRPNFHAPPIVRLIWDDQIFKGVIESLNITFVLFTPDGVPVRAKLNMTLKEYRPVVVQVLETPTNSPDVDKTHTLVRGESLADVSWQAFGDPRLWREIARNNDIDDPRRVEPGQTLSIPRLR